MGKANVYYFNPTCELAVANSSFSFMPPLLLQEMERDLSILPFVFATENDFILTENIPSDGFLQKLKHIGFNLPSFCSLADMESLPSGLLGNICPWGWSPAAHFKLRKLKEKCDQEFRIDPISIWRKDHQKLFERSSSLSLLTKIVNQNPPEWIIGRSLIGEIVTNCIEIELLLKKHTSIVLKAPMSSSGRGIQIIRKPRLRESNKQWITGVLRQQNYLIAEPFLEKLIDFSFQFQILPNAEIKYLGYSVFETNSNGQYKGTLINPYLKSILPEENTSELETMIGKTAMLLSEYLKKSLYTEFYHGFFGVDALIFKHHDRLMIQPCIEVNSRMNMGVLSMYLEKQLHPQATGKFELFYGKPGEYLNFVKENLKLYPIKLRDEQLYSGFISLVEPTENKKFGAYIALGTAR